MQDESLNMRLQQARPIREKIRLCGCYISQLALSLDGPYPRKMSEKRGEVIVPAGRRYQQKQHELLPAAKGLNF